MSKNENTILTEWLKKVADESFGKDLGYENVNCWLSPDRPNPDLVIECTKHTHDGSGIFIGETQFFGRIQYQRGMQYREAQCGENLNKKQCR